jgi:hypothetical protein
MLFGVAKQLSIRNMPQTVRKNRLPQPPDKMAD